MQFLLSVPVRKESAILFFLMDTLITFKVRPLKCDYQLRKGDNRMNYIIIPAYEPGSEMVTLAALLRRQSDAVIIAVNDGSGPDYVKYFEQLDPSVTVIGYPDNRGKGYAIKYALQYIQDLGQGQGSIVTADADGQHRAEDILRVLGESAANPGLLILGSRAFDTDVPLRSRFGNSITREVFARVSGQRVRDTQTGLRAFGTSAIPFMLSVEGGRYEYEMNVLLEWAHDKRPIREITIDTVYHDAANSCSHFRTVTDSIRIYKQILRRSTSLLFAFSSFSSFLLDYVLFLLLVQVFGAAGAAWGVVAANVSARLISAFFKYNLNRLIVFKSHASARQTGLAYALLALGILAGNSMILAFFTDLLHLVPALAKILTELTLFITSYAVQKHVIFRSYHHSKEKGNCHDTKSII